MPTTRTDTIDAYREYLEKKSDLESKNLPKIAELEKKMPSTSRRVKGFLATGFTTFGASLPAGFFIPSEDPGLVALGFLGGGAAILLGTFIPLHDFDKRNSLIRETREGNHSAFRQFLNTVSGELRDKGLNIMEINHEKKYIVTDRGNVTVVFNEGSDVPQVLLNGELIQSTYLSDTREVVDVNGRKTRVPDALASI